MGRKGRIGSIDGLDRSIGRGGRRGGSGGMDAPVVGVGLSDVAERRSACERVYRNCAGAGGGRGR